MLVGVFLECLVAHHLEQFGGGVGAVLVVFAQHRARFGLESVDRVRQILEAIGLDFQNGVEIFLGESGVVIGVVIGSIGILSRAGFGDDRLIFIRRVGFGTAEHHVLEEVREAGFARLDFVARAGLHRNLQRDDIREAGRHHDHLEAIRQRFLAGGEGQQVGFFNCAQRCGRGGGLCGG